jgi:Ser/Thr protein kinase RdoA (MazF antagonist)
MVANEVGEFAEQREALACWFNKVVDVRFEESPNRGFSGARVWKATRADGSFALHRWPGSFGTPCRLTASQMLQAHLADAGLPVPRPLLMPGESWSRSQLDVHREHRCTWGLETWMPGKADYWQLPSPSKLRAALAMLAKIHVSAAELRLSGDKYEPRIATSPALRKRASRLQQFVSGEFSQLQMAVGRCSGQPNIELGREVLNLAQRAAPVELDKARHWLNRELRLQWRHGDPWHDHILFSGDEVTGVIDFAAANVDSPAGDVARLLGSLVPDDPGAWTLGLEEYEQHRRLSDAERDAIPCFDSSGVVISAINWINWLFSDAEQLGEGLDRSAAFERLRRLATRLRVLVEPK